MKNQLPWSIAVLLVFLVRTVSADGLWLAQPQVGDWVEFETKNDLSGPTARDSPIRAGFGSSS